MPLTNQKQQIFPLFSRKFYFAKKNTLYLVKLESKSSDEDFLNGSTVTCDAVIPSSQHQSGVLKEGERIVVLLSNGKKYMGEISSFQYQVKDNRHEGKLELKRYSKK